MQHSDIAGHIEDIICTLSAGMVPEARGEIVSLRRLIRRGKNHDLRGITGKLVAARTQLDGRPGMKKQRLAGDLLRSVCLAA